jgi:hypothetical protein
MLLYYRLSVGGGRKIAAGPGFGIFGQRDDSVWDADRTHLGLREVLEKERRERS